MMGLSPQLIINMNTKLRRFRRPIKLNRIYGPLKAIHTIRNNKIFSQLTTPNYYSLNNS